MTNKDTGDLVRAMRKMRRLTQLEVALLCGSSRPSIAMIETGRQGCSLAMLERIANALDYTVHISFRGKP